MIKKWLFIGLAVVIAAVAGRAIYTLYSGVEQLDSATNQQTQPTLQDKRNSMPAAPAIVVQQAAITPEQKTSKTNQTTTPQAWMVNKDPSTDANGTVHEQIADPGDVPQAVLEAFPATDPEGLSYGERLAREAEIRQRGEQEMAARVAAGLPPVAGN